MRFVLLLAGPGSFDLVSASLRETLTPLRMTGLGKETTVTG